MKNNQGDINETSNKKRLWYYINAASAAAGKAGNKGPADPVAKYWRDVAMENREERRQLRLAQRQKADRLERI